MVKTRPKQLTFCTIIGKYAIIHYWFTTAEWHRFLFTGIPDWSGCPRLHDRKETEWISVAQIYFMPLKILAFNTYTSSKQLCNKIGISFLGMITSNFKCNITVSLKVPLSHLHNKLVKLYFWKTPITTWIMEQKIETRETRTNPFNFNNNIVQENILEIVSIK